VTSYHPTWSATEYDRTPLEPPSEAERTCVLPERNSRSLRTSLECFTSEYDLSMCPSLTAESSMSSDPAEIDTPPCENEEIECDPESAQWEECMDRRRMMFANMCNERDRHPEFDGYRSISAKLVELLSATECAEIEEGKEGEGEDEGDEMSMDSDYFARLQGGMAYPVINTPSLVSSVETEESGPVSPGKGALVATGNRKEEVVEQRKAHVSSSEDEFETVEF